MAMGDATTELQNRVEALLYRLDIAEKRIVDLERNQALDRVSVSAPKITTVDALIEYDERWEMKALMSWGNQESPNVRFHFEGDVLTNVEIIK